jgi:hypothetical protein
MKRLLAGCSVTAVFGIVALALLGFSPAARSATSPSATAETTSTTVATASATAGDSDGDGIIDGDDPCPGDARNACFGTVAIDESTGNPIRINTGPHSSLACARTQLDCNGDQWLEDFGYHDRAALSGCPARGELGHSCTLSGVDDVLGCDDEPTQLVFRCGHRPRKHTRPLLYEFALAPGSYLVNLYFVASEPRSPERMAETGATIQLNGADVYTRFDPAAVAEAAGQLVVRSAVVSVEQDGLRVALLDVRRRTALRALEVLGEAGAAELAHAPTVNAPAQDTDGVTSSATASDGDNDGIIDTSDPCPTDPRNRCVGPIAVDSATGKQIRVNANVSSAECSGTKTDCAGTTWNGDFGYNQSGKAGTCDLGGGGEGCVITGITTLFGCENETTEDIFQCEHSDAATAPELAYSFSVPNGKYVVNLFFANTYTGTSAVGSRVFDIRFEGATVYTNFDQIAAAGASGKAVVRAAVVNVTDGNGLQLDLIHKSRTPALKAIEVYAYTTSCTSASQCDDTNPCTNDACTSGTCTHTNNSAVCASDSNPCTNDVCSAGTCTHPSNTAACNDGLACTTSDICSGGVCTGTSTCPTGQVCSATTGQCTSSDNDNDGLAGTNDPCPTDARNLCVGPVATDSTTGKKIRLNANVSSAECSGAKTDCKGAVWEADFGYNQTVKASTCDLSGGGESCVIGNISAIFGCDSESTEDLFQCDHYDAAAAPELIYDFSVPNGRYLVNLFFANTYTGTAGAGTRVFDIKLENTVVYPSFDQVVAAGGSGKAVVRSAVVYVSDGNGLQIELGRKVENPAIKAIEVLQYGATTCTTVSQCNDNNPCTTDACTSGQCQNTPNTASCNDGVACTSNDVCGASVCRGTSNCPSGQSCNTSTGMCGAGQVSFGKSALSGATLVHPTSLQFGPDNKLYVAQQDGLIKVYTVTRTSQNHYNVTATQTLTQIQSIPNHNDDGILNSSITKRLVTGLLVAGTAANPVIYVTSSDPRIGGGANSNDTNLDTNSGVISRLTWNGSSWQKLDLVRGLPRSEENHAANGMWLNTATNTLYVTQGGNTNEGATSNNFVYLPEYALSAAILSVNLTAIGNTTYDIPTLNDESRSGTTDANDPFGGNDGKNQAKIVSGGPVQVYSPGWRNPYDIVVTKLGKMYAIDNGANAGWGDIPVGNGTPSCTNGSHEAGHSCPDNLHLITGPGYYAGHPNPTRGNANNKFNPTNPQSPVPGSNSAECTFREPGVSDGALATFSPSTNGLTEYTASNFGNQMKGDLLAAGWDNNIYLIDLNSTGTAVNNVSVLFSSVAPSSKALDLVAQGDAGPFAGSVWATDYNGGTIVVYEANDMVSCSGQDSTTLDDDGDGFDNADEIDNGTNPCSAADTPPDDDGDKTSNLNDPDDDNDGQLDTTDPFALDAQNGKGTNLPVIYTWENNAPSPGGLLNLGFTGLMTNGAANYETLFNPDDVTSSGAAGVFTVDLVAEGDAYQTLNTQKYGFQLGVNVTPATGPVTVHTRIVGPFLGTTPQDFQSMGLFVGTGRQSDYVKIVTAAHGGTGGIELVKEVGDVIAAGPSVDLAMPGPDAIDLYLGINPSSATMQGYYTVTTNGVTSGLLTVGSSVFVPANWFTNASTGLAVGIISTSRGVAPTFAATWDFIEVTPGMPTCADPDGDGKCSQSDPCPDDGLDDVDGDGICEGSSFNTPKTGAGDNCPTKANANQANADGDSRGDGCDACPSFSGVLEDLCLGSGSWTTLAPATIMRHEGGMAAVGGQELPDRRR